jgi:hypothetical protein
MTNNDLYTQFAEQARVILKDEDRVADAIAELGTLDQREADIVLNSMNHVVDSVEYLHSKIRLASLVASGVISADLVAAADPAEYKEETAWSPADYEYSRDAFLQTLADQHFSSDILKNPYDYDGTISRMVSRGDSRQKISEYLEGNAYFQGQKDLTTIDPADLDLEEQLALSKYMDLVEALNNIVDPEVEPDFVANAKELVKPYDQDGTVSELINSGSTSTDIFEKLKENTSWNTDAYDYITRGEVDSSTPAQRARWNDFGAIVFAIKDLDSTAK